MVDCPKCKEKYGVKRKMVKRFYIKDEHHLECPKCKHIIKNTKLQEVQ